MKVLVTGAEGYIGVVLASALLTRGHDVVGLDTGFYRDGWLYQDGRLRRPRCLARDLRRLAPEDVRGYDAVVHLAELSNDPLGQLHPHITHDINHRGSVRLARLCREQAVSRFVYTSSCSVYGVAADGPRTEACALSPQTAYAQCKALVERDVSAMAGDDFSPTFLRNATAYGPSPRMRFDLVLNNLAGLAWTTGQISMVSDGTPWRPLVHVSDICEAIACTLAAPREAVHNQVFNVGDDRENYQVREIAEIVARVFPRCELKFGGRSADTRSYRVSFEKIRRCLPGFRCRRTALQGALELREIFGRVGMTRAVFEHRAFTRLKQLEHLLETRRLDEHFYWTAPAAPAPPSAPEELACPRPSR
ncbi:MAG: NAD-dependent epimerase/dehydratase family protein [Candidatus Methylomirabilales bacterium]